MSGVTEAVRTRGPRKRRGGRDLPTRLPILPLINTVVFPRMTVPLLVDASASVAALRAAEKIGPLILLVAQRDDSLKDVNSDDLFPVGTIAQVVQSIRVPDGGMQVVVQGMTRAKILNIAQIAPDPVLEPATDGAAAPPAITPPADFAAKPVAEHAETARPESPAIDGNATPEFAPSADPVEAPMEAAVEANPKVVLMSAYDAVIADVAVKDRELASSLKRKRGAISRRR